MRDQLKYGPVLGEESCVKVPVIIQTAEVVRAKSGRFVTLNSGYLEVADAGDSLLEGWMETASGTSVAGQMGNLIPAKACAVVFRIPIITGTLVEAMLGKTCDLVRATVGGVTNVQGADLTASGEDVITIVGGDIDDNNYVDVMITPSKVTGLTGVA